MAIFRNTDASIPDYRIIEKTRTAADRSLTIGTPAGSYMVADSYLTTFIPHGSWMVADSYLTTFIPHGHLQEHTDG